MRPTLGNGKICYGEIPALDIERSAEFYQRTFSWSIRKRGNGSTVFDDSVGQVSGSWVDNVAAALDNIVKNGGAIAQPIGADAPEITARFKDPAGNVPGLYQEPA